MVELMRMPSRHELARQCEVSDRVAVEAVRLLAAAGFVEARAGSGTYVRHRPEQQRLTARGMPPGKAARRSARRWARRAGGPGSAPSERAANDQEARFQRLGTGLLSAKAWSGWPDLNRRPLRPDAN